MFNFISKIVNEIEIWNYCSFFLFLKDKKKCVNKNIPCLIPIKDSHVSHNLQHNFLTDQFNNTPLKHFPSKNFTDCIHLWIRIIKIKGQIFFFFRPIWSLRKIHLVSVVFGISYFSKCLRVESIVQEQPGNAEASLVLLHLKLLNLKCAFPGHLDFLAASPLSLLLSWLEWMVPLWLFHMPQWVHS